MQSKKRPAASTSEFPSRPALVKKPKAFGQRRSGHYHVRGMAFARPGTQDRIGTIEPGSAADC